MKPFLTILTPTFNRAELLKRGYRSLLRQTNRNFEWLIVDDGSTDYTRDLVASFEREKKISIRYLYKENGGKHTALNMGVRDIRSELTLILDSDDYLANDAVETILSCFYKYRDQKNLCAFSFLRIHPDGTPVSGKLPCLEFISSYIDCRIKKKLRGDMAEVFFTRCLREFPFPEFQGEKFISEDAVWIPMSLKYQMVFIRKPIYYCDYLEGGLTKSGRAMRLRSPLGGMARAKMLMLRQCGFPCRVKGALLYVCNGKIARKSFWDMYRACDAHLFFSLSYPFGVLLYRLWKQKYSL